MEHRSPRFESTRLPPTPPRLDPRAIVDPTVDWAKIDQNGALKHELMLRAIAWALADRKCDDLAAVLDRVKDEALASQPADKPKAFAQLGEAETHFQQACRQFEQCDDEFRQAARKLVDALECSIESQAALTRQNSPTPG